MTTQLEGASHKELRKFLRVIGPLVVMVGGLLALVGLGSFFSSFGSFEPPKYFWCAFVGLPMIGVGLSICNFAFLGSIQRYVASESAPVARDTFNYMVDGTQESVRNLSKSVGSGIREAFDSGVSDSIVCSQCNDLNAAEARFCNGCGAPLLVQQICGKCGKENDGDAKFCDRCGTAL